MEHIVDIEIRPSLPQHVVTVTCKRLCYTTTIIDGRAGGTIAPQTKIWEAEPPPPPPPTHTYTHFGARKHLQMNFTCVIDNFRAFLP